MITVIVFAVWISPWLLMALIYLWSRDYLPVASTWKAYLPLCALPWLVILALDWYTHHGYPPHTLVHDFGRAFESALLIILGVVPLMIMLVYVGMGMLATMPPPPAKRTPRLLIASGISLALSPIAYYAASTLIW
jgi:hypothetical protein